PDQQPEHHRRDSRCDAAARKRQQQRDERRVQIHDSHRPQPIRPSPRRRDPQGKRHREHAKQRENVPVADRAVQPRDALGLDRKRREDLRRERHADRDRRHGGEPPGGEPRRTPPTPPIHMSGLSAEPSLNRTAAAINTAEPPATSAWGARNPRGRVETSSLFARRSRAVCIASEATEITFGSGTPNKRLTPFGQTSEMRRLSVAALAVAVVSVLAVAASPSVARAAEPCWQRVLDDWTKDGKIDGQYSPRCLRQAIKNTP